MDVIKAADTGQWRLPRDPLVLFLAKLVLLWRGRPCSGRLQVSDEKASFLEGPDAPRCCFQ
jgi:hypothetical protein